MNSKVTGALGAAAPYALIAGLGFLALKLFEGIAPSVGAAAGGAVGGTFGGVIRGLGEGLGIAPNVSEPILSAVLPSTDGAQSASIISPANNSTLWRAVGINYPVRANISWPRAEAVMVNLHAKEYPRGGGDEGEFRKASSVKLTAGRNVLDFSMQLSTGPLCDIVLTLSVDGTQYASSFFYVT